VKSLLLLRLNSPVFFLGNKCDHHFSFIAGLNILWMVYTIISNYSKLPTGWMACLPFTAAHVNW